MEKKGVEHIVDVIEWYKLIQQAEQQGLSKDEVRAFLNSKKQSAATDRM